MLENPILYPAAGLLDPLEFGAAATLTDPRRAEIMARFKAALQGRVDVGALECLGRLTRET